MLRPTAEQAVQEAQRLVLRKPGVPGVPAATAATPLAAATTPAATPLRLASTGRSTPVAPPP